uniref:SPOR domain-containing protein n=1 Tax=Bradyrhizobium sp. S69 TaxID=1641856 RepID=UPI00157728F5
PADANADVAEDEAQSRPTQAVQVQGAVQVASASSEPTVLPPTRSIARPSVLAAAAAAMPPAQAKFDHAKLDQAKPEPAPLSSGVIQSQSIAAIPGSSEPMKPVKVKTVQIKAGQVKVASAATPSQAGAPVTNSISSMARPDVPETSGAVVSKAETARVDAAEMPPQPARFGTGNGVLGVLPASSVPASPPSQAMAYAAPPQPQAVQQNGAIRPVAAHTGWIIQVGALESESEARERIDAARSQARGLLSKADPFTEAVVAKGDRKLFRARFAGLDRDQAEAVCRTLKRSEISCITVKN